MELKLKIIGLDGTARVVRVKPGESVKIQPGETVVVAPDQDQAVSTSREGDTLVIHTRAGDIKLHGFFEPPSQEQLPAALVYEDAAGLHLVGAQAEQISQSFTMQPLSVGHMPDAFDLPGQFSLPDNTQWTAAFRTIFAVPDPLDAAAASTAAVDPLARAADMGGSPASLAPHGLAAEQALDEIAKPALSGQDDPLLPFVNGQLRSISPPPSANDSPPSMADQQFSTNENGAVGTVVGSVLASDPDAGQSLTYSIVGGSGATAFQIDATTGELTVADTAQLDSETVGALTLVVEVTDSGASPLSDSATITIKLNDLNEFTPSFISNPNFGVAEHGVAVGNFVATDADASVAPLTYSLIGGADRALFTINATTGALRFVAAPNFEDPADAGADNVYNVDVRVSDGARAVTQNVVVTVTNVNEAPVITSAATTAVAENQTAVLSVVTSDPEGDLSTFSIVGGADAAKFSIDANTGALRFIVGPNFEAPADANGDNVYAVQVRANDSHGGLATQSLSVTVTEVNDLAPVVTSSATANFAENGTGTVLDVNATDGDLPVQTLTFAITGGAEAAKFAINTTTGRVTFVAAPDFETPSDADGNNVYVLQVTASDGSLSTAQTINVTVTGVNDNSPVITSSATTSFAENSAGTVIDVNATDADLPGQTLTFVITGGADAAKFAINATTGIVSFIASPNFEAPTDVGANNVYNLQVTVSDGTRTTTQSLAVTVTGVNDNSPIITSAASASRFTLGIFSLPSRFWILDFGFRIAYVLAIIYQSKFRINPKSKI